MPIDPGASGREHPALGGAGRGVRPGTPLPHSRAPPLADPSPHDPVAYPSPEPLPHVGLLPRVEELPEVHLPDPSPPLRPPLVLEVFQGLGCRSPWPKPVRAGLEVLLVDRLPQHDDRPLEDFVLRRRYPDRPGPGRPGSFREVRPAHRRCPVGAGLGPVQERTPIGVQVRFVVRGGYPGPTRGPAPAPAPARPPPPRDGPR